MEVFDAVRTILAVRSFQPKAVPAEVIRRIVEAGRLSGSSMNLQPWHCSVVEERAALQKLGELARSGPYTAGAAFAVVVLIEKSSPFGVSDGSRAVQSMMLTAWAEGVGSNWVGFPGSFAAVTGLQDLLGAPDTHDVLAVVPFGYPEKEIGRGKKKRKALGEVAHAGRFGSPFA